MSKVVIVGTGDHHSGPDYDFCFIVDDAVNIDTLVEEFHRRYPSRCLTHNNIWDDPHYQCADCHLAYTVGDSKLQTDGLGGWDDFKNATFARWLQKVMGYEKVELDITYVY